MEVLRVSDFFEKDMPPILLGGFFSRRVFTENNKYIFIYTSYKKSQKIDTKEIAFESYDREYIEALNNETGQYPYWYTKDKIIDELRKNGSVRIPFSRFYDTRQYIKNMDGCFIEILKV